MRLNALSVNRPPTRPLMSSGTTLCRYVMVKDIKGACVSPIKKAAARPYIKDGDKAIKTTPLELPRPVSIRTLPFVTSLLMAAILITPTTAPAPKKEIILEKPDSPTSKLFVTWDGNTDSNDIVKLQCNPISTSISPTPGFL